MRKVPLADVLWDAANKYLSADGRNAYGETDEFSCYATSLAEGRGYAECYTAHYRTQGQCFLYDLGCSHDPFAVWDCALNDWRLQGVRYMWLLLAMHVAESEGIMVEVPQ